jgi:hypothetical protein
MKRIRFIEMVVAAVGISMAFAACDEGVVTDPRQIVMPESDVSYNRDIQPVFDLSCALSGCHDDATRAGGLSLRSYSDLLARPGIIHPGDSTESVLRKIIRGIFPHPAYPISALLTQNHMKGIAVWIEEGASNN